jgi:uroporphyrin-III C-methyltransferase
MSVYLVGAGPGDPELITVRGLELLRRCDVLVHDRLVAPELVAEAPDDALCISRESLGQAAINDLLVSYGRRGLDVVRLKGGDPFVFGRGGEEALALAAAGVAFEVVPGVSSLQAVPAAAGIPITHRGLASQVTVLSGHDSALDYDALARAPGTLVVFMALSNVEAIANGLVAHGKDPRTPSAVVSRGTLPEQRTVTAPLSEIAQVARDLESPALVIVGDTVALARRLAPAADSLARVRITTDLVHDQR